MPVEARDRGTIVTPSQEMLIKAALHDCWLKVGQNQPVFEVLAEAAELIRRCLNGRRVRIASRCSADDTIVALAGADLHEQPDDAAEPEVQPSPLPGSSEVGDPEAVAETPTPDPEHRFEFPLCQDGQQLGVLTVEFLESPNLSQLLLMERCAELITPLVLFRCRINSWSRSAHQLHDICDRSEIPLLKVDANLRVTYWSSAAAAAFGWNADEILGQRLPLISASGWTSFQHAVLQACLTPAVKRVDVECGLRHGESAKFSVALFQQIISPPQSQEICCLWFDRSQAQELPEIDEFLSNCRAVLQRPKFLENHGAALLRLLGEVAKGIAGEIWEYDGPRWNRLISWNDSRIPIPPQRQSVMTISGWMLDKCHLQKLERERMLFLPASLVPRYALRRRASDHQSPPNYLILAPSTEVRALALVIWGDQLRDLTARWRQAITGFEFELRQQLVIQELRTQMDRHETLRRSCEPLNLAETSALSPPDLEIVDQRAGADVQTLELIHQIFESEPLESTRAMSQTTG